MPRRSWTKLLLWFAKVQTERQSSMTCLIEACVKISSCKVRSYAFVLHKLEVAVETSCIDRG